MRHSRRGLVGAVLALTLVGLAACSSGSGSVGTPSTVSGAQEGGKLTIGISFDQPGLGFKDGETYRGFDVDTATYVAAALGVPSQNITWVQADPSEREKLLESGDVDLVFSSYSITDQRKQVVDFAGPYFVAHQDLLVRRNDEELTGPDRLKGRTLCAAANTTSAQNVLNRYQGDVALVQPNTFSECVKRLTTGDVDAVTTDDIILAGFAALPANKGVLRVLNKGFSDEPYGIAMPKGSGQLVTQVNQALTSYIADGSWKASLERNVGPSGYKIPDPPTPGK